LCKPKRSRSAKVIGADTRQQRFDRLREPRGPEAAVEAACASPARAHDGTVFCEETVGGGSQELRGG